LRKRSIPSGDYNDKIGFETDPFQQRGSDRRAFERTHVRPLTRVMARRLKEKEGA